MAKGGPRGSTRNPSRPRDCMPTAPPDATGREGGSVPRPPPLFSAFPAAAPCAGRRVRGASDPRRHLVFLFGVAPTAIGLAFGLLLRGLSFVPFDLPHYRMIPHGTAYVDLRYGRALALSAACHGRIVGRVTFRAFYGLGFSGHRLRLGRHLQRRLLAGDSGRTAGRSWRARHCEIRAWSGLAGSGLVTLRLHSADRAPAPPCRAPRRAASSCP